MDELPTIPGYTCARLLGEGAYGRVYLAREQAGLERQVAIKLYTRAGDDAFARELAALKRVEALRQAGAPGLVASLATGEHAGQGFLVFEYLDQGSLADRVEAQGPLAVTDALALAREVGGALEALHAAGIWHRDVKPHNVLLGADGQARLADFGLARGLSGTLSAAGSPAFAAPEVIAGRPSDGPRADVYSLGATLIYALTGATILPGRPDAFALEQAGVPRPLQQVLLAATAADPEERLPAVGELLQGLSARSEKNSETPRTSQAEPDLESDRTSERTTSMPYSETSDPLTAAPPAPTRTSRAAAWSLVLALLVIPSAVVIAGVTGAMFASGARERMRAQEQAQRASFEREDLEARWEAASEAERAQLATELEDLHEREAETRERAQEHTDRAESAKAWVALVSAVVILGCEFGAILLGILGLVAIGRDPSLSGKGLAIGGLVVAGLNLFAAACLVAGAMSFAVRQPEPSPTPLELVPLEPR